MTAPAPSIAFHAAAPHAEKGYVLLAEPGSAPGRVRVRRWRSPDYTADAPPVEQDVAELRAALSREARKGWRFTLPPEQVLAWLDELGS